MKGYKWIKIEYIETDYEEIIKIHGEIYKCHRILYSRDWIQLLRDKLGIEVVERANIRQQ